MFLSFLIMRFDPIGKSSFTPFYFVVWLEYHTAKQRLAPLCDPHVNFMKQQLQLPSRRSHKEPLWSGSGKLPSPSRAHLLEHDHHVTKFTPSNEVHLVSSCDSACGLCVVGGNIQSEGEVPLGKVPLSYLHSNAVGTKSYASHPTYTR